MPMPGSLIALCAHYPQRVVPAGAVLLEEGRQAGVIYVLEAGTVEIIKRGQPITAVSQPGSVFGEISVLLAQGHMATVRVRSESRFRVIEDPLAFLRAHPDAAWHVAMLLAQRLSGTMEYLVDLKRQHADRQEYVTMVDGVLASLLHLHGPPRRPGEVSVQRLP